MSAGDKVREVVQDLTGIEWPAADEDKLRDIAKAWRKFAEDMEDVTVAANKAAQTLIHNNTGEAISAFDDPFWRRYYHDKKGWLQDLIDGPRALADGLDKYADAVADAKKKLEHELEIVGATIVAGTALAIFTFGVSEAAAAAASVTIIELAATLGVTLSTVVADIAATTFVTAAFAGIESVTVDLAVAQNMAINFGMQDGFNLDEAQSAGFYGAATGGAFGGLGKSAQAISEAGGISRFFQGIPIDIAGPRLAMAGIPPLGPGQPLLRVGQGGGYGAARQPPHYCQPLDGVGRAQGVDTTITKSMLDTGSKAGRRVQPPGWGGDTAGHTRGHLLARSLGGDGKAPENIVIMYDKANNEVMQKMEKQIYAAVDAGHDVKYLATPVYRNPSDLIPSGVHVVAKGGGLEIDQTIINK
ncbi:DNA/RNA non-specific endonuclease [Streptomyces sp. NPDC048479]|uniref:DNA/RNA non-specific endonuclease n=1 Tax=Streptomyces sp. NPDC048479 TaxID=3154725 RepID=UPI0034410984